MKAVGVRDLKQNASKVLAAVQAGASATVTDRGRPVARLVPISSDRFEEMIAEGRVRQAKRPIVKLGPAPVALGRPSLSEALAYVRGDERF
jgi:prevent-host-death family protein